MEKGFISMFFYRSSQSPTTYQKWFSQYFWIVDFSLRWLASLLLIIFVALINIFLFWILLTIFSPAYLYRLQLHALNDRSTLLRIEFHLGINIILGHDACYFSIPLYILPHLHIYRHHNLTFYPITMIPNIFLLLYLFEGLQLFLKCPVHAYSFYHLSISICLSRLCHQDIKIFHNPPVHEGEFMGVFIMVAAKRLPFLDLFLVPLICNLL